MGVQFIPHAFQNKITAGFVVPKILMSRKAYFDMFFLVDECSQEVGWIGTVKVLENNVFYIEEIFIPKQKVHSTTTEIDPEGISEWVQEMLLRPDGMDVVNNFRFWGHSHVNMGTSASGQDETQIKTFMENIEDYFIRGIFNKHGRAEFTLFLVKSAIRIDDVSWSIEGMQEPSREDVKKVIAEKVKSFSETKVYGMGAGYTHYGKGYQGYQGKYGQWEDDDYTVAGYNGNQKEIEDFNRRYNQTVKEKKVAETVESEIEVAEALKKGLITERMAETIGKFKGRITFKI